MEAELLFGLLLLLGIILFNKQYNKLKSYLGNDLYFCWFLLSISVFDFTPSVLQYAIRLLAILISFVCIIREQGKIYFISIPITFVLIVYLCFCGVSALWSVDALQTIVKVVELLIDIFVIMAILSSENSYQIAVKKMIQVIFWMLVFVEIYSCIGAVLLPSLFLRYSRGVFGFQLTGVIVSSNSLGTTAIFVIIYLLNKDQMRYKKTVLALSVAVLFLAQARTSIASFAIIMLVYFFRTKRKGIYFACVAIACCVLFYYRESVMAYLIRGTDEGNLQTMSGRTTMWDSAMELIKLKPWFGYGFGSGGEIVSKLNSGMSSLHSGIYETLIGVGYVGLIFLAFIYAIGCLMLLRSIFKSGLLRNGFEVMLWIDVSIRTYLSTGLGGWQSFLIMIWYLLLIAMSLFKANITVTDSLNLAEEELYIDDD